MMDNYPPGAANDPRAPYNEPTGDEKEVTVTLKMVKTAVILVERAYTHIEYEYDPVEGLAVPTAYEEYGNDLEAYFNDQYRTPVQIIQCCQKIVKELLKQGNRFFAGISLYSLDEDCEYWEEDEMEVSE